MNTTHIFNHIAPDTFRCTKCGLETGHQGRRERASEECPVRVREEAERKARDPLGARALARSIEGQKRALASAEAQLRSIQATCQHEWSEPEYTPEVREAYRTEDLHGHFIEGQAPRMVTVPREEKPKWTRTCRRCGKVETTTTVTEQVTRAPRF